MCDLRRASLHPLNKQNTLGRRSSVGADATAGSAEISELSIESHIFSGQRKCFTKSETQLIDQFMVRETCYFASDYQQEIREMSIPANMSAKTAVVQFPYTEAVGLSRSYELAKLICRRLLSKNPRPSKRQRSKSEKSTVGDYKKCRPRQEQTK